MSPDAALSRIAVSVVTVRTPAVVARRRPFGVIAARVFLALACVLGPTGLHAQPGQPMPATTATTATTTPAASTPAPPSMPAAPAISAAPVDFQGSTVPQTATAPEAPAPEAPAPAAPTGPDPLQAPPSAAPAAPGPVVLLLPSGAQFARAAAALRAGFKAAHERDATAVGIEMLETADDAETLTARYRDLAARGASVVVGPLTRAGVNALADLGALPVPTLTLNQPDAERLLPANALAFGLPIEAEARQLARLAFADAAASLATRHPQRTLPHAAVVGAPSPLARRAAAAFSDAWRELGGHAEASAEVEPRAAAELRAQLEAAGADAVFVAGGADLVRATRGAMAASPLPLYVTSMVTAASPIDRRLPELDGVRMVEMPWLLASERAAGNAYPRPMGAMANTELQRLYALGIDAYRVAVLMGRARGPIELDGVTGRLTHDGTQPRLERAGVASEFRNGLPVATRAP